MGHFIVRRGLTVFLLLTIGAVAGRAGLGPTDQGARAANPTAAIATAKNSTTQGTMQLDLGQTFSLTALEQQVVKTSRDVAREVVQVENVGVGLGSGVIATSDGYIVTNNHVVANGTRFFVTLSGGQRLAARLVGTSPTDDLAVLKVNKIGLPAARFGNSDFLLVGQEVLAIGNPLGLGETVTSGVVSALNRTMAEGEGSAAYLPHAIQTSAPINPGNSGGALVSLDGQVVGIPTLGVGSPQGGAAQGIGFAIPSARIRVIVPQLITAGRVTHTARAYLGIGTQTAAASDPNNPFGSSDVSANGVVIGAVGANTPASRAGLRVNDSIVSLAGRPVQNTDTLFSILADLHVGQSVQIVVERPSNDSTSATRISRTIVLGELPANPS